ncbi:5-methylcytosine rRNA methyltransferase NSUN4-like isoform X2 [Mytilus californianus]|uniref:5-methylcytosine rRNA methyltransferase NSUN4-like isoform X2 n=1 Tax=Mytilus californianus TaxID=6549 RepID=UPI002246A422|nr:5-methylcytosine rRNA methyltransferase NSUN4-like isoform X2 [Mytilus californianus]
MSRTTICNSQLYISYKLLTTNKFISFKQMRHIRYKKKMAFQSNPKSNKQHALNNFDMYYSNYYKELWPSIRISLLSQQKYCALVNHCDEGTTFKAESILSDLGAEDFIQKAVDISTDLKTEHSQSIETGSLSTKKDKLIDSDDSDKDNTQPSHRSDSIVFSSNNEPLDEKNTSLYDFMPTNKVYTQREFLYQELARQNTFEDTDFPVNVITEDIPGIPDTLKAYCHKRGNIDLFPEPTISRGNSKLGYYMMDAASLLPVIALDVQDNDNVLDMCSAPGGKMLAMLQYQHSGTLLCNDSSKSRLQRLTRTLHSYGNQTMIDMVTVHQDDGVTLNEPSYEKVLVDVPCTNDRHSALEDDNNMFKPGRMKERLQIPATQKHLLLAGIMSCVPGGSVVYLMSMLYFVDLV